MQERNNMAKYAINGRFLTQRITGVQRFEREIVKSIDMRVRQDEFCIVVPRKYDKSFKLKNIEIVETGRTSGIIWEQIDFCIYLIKNKMIGINLGNVAPLIKPDIVCIHDVKLVHNPKWFNWKYVIWSKLNYRNALMRGKLVLTVSEFSKTEIKAAYPELKADIVVLDEGWQHMERIEENPVALKKYGIKKGEYYFSVYQSIPNKNFQWILKAADANQKDIFVVSGWNNRKTNNTRRNEFSSIEKNNVKILGYISDGEMKTLVKNCKAFLFPSLYEGFGIPPLEALSVGAKVLVMDIPVMREVFGDGVQYIQNDCYVIDIDNRIKGDRALKSHSWDKGAERLLFYIHRLEELSTNESLLHH